MVYYRKQPRVGFRHCKGRTGRRAEGSRNRTRCRRSDQGLDERDNLLITDLDVTKPADAEAAVKAAVVKFGAVDVLVNNASYGHFGPFEEASVENVAKQFDVNLFGAMHVTRAV